MTEVKVEKQIRHLPRPASLAEWLFRLRFTLARRAVQLLVLVLFIGTFRFAWKIGETPVLTGDLSSSKLLDLIPMSDPFGALQRLVAQHWLSSETLIGAGVVLLIYLVISGRSFCSWVCPMNMVTDFAYWLRERLGLRSSLLNLPSWLRYVLFVTCLILSAVTFTAAFEAFSPQALIWRDVVYGTGLGALGAALGVLAFDFGVSKRGWCGHLCPLGAFWALYGKIGLTKVKYDESTCTKCGDCIKICPEPQVLNLKSCGKVGMVASSECTNCGKCIAVCPEKSLSFGLRNMKRVDK